METRFRYGDVVSTATARQQPISYNQLTPKPRYDAAGVEIPYRPSRLRLRPLDVYRLLRPYLAVRLNAQLRAVVPLALYLVAFQIYLLHTGIAEWQTVTLGLLGVVLGLVLFMEGIKHGLMPFGENLGNLLPRKLHLSGVLLVAFLLGIGVTLAEPAIGALQTSGSIVSAARAPHLYLLLNQWSGWLVLAVGIGVGLAAVLATLRLVWSWSLKPLIVLTLLPTLLLTGYILTVPEWHSLLGLAWDCGAVTTGPVTVPLVLALGIGVSSAAGKGQEALSGFGLVTLASLLPVLSVLILGLLAVALVPVDSIGEFSVAAGTAWHARSPGAEIVAGLRAIVPLIGFLLIVMLLVLREKPAKPGTLAYGLVLAVLGMIVFNLGLTYGLGNLGGQAGKVLPAAFEAHPAVPDAPLYAWLAGVFVVWLFALLLGFAATLAEPALHAVGLTVETLTQGAFRKGFLIYVVSVGVAAGISLGVLQLIFDWPLGYLLLAGYALALGLSYYAREEIVNIAWDCAGVTTGPVTVPLVLAMGLGLGQALQRAQGFGILALASVGPILSVLAAGLWIDWQVRRSHRRLPQAEETGT